MKLLSMHFKKRTAPAPQKLQQEILNGEVSMFNNVFHLLYLNYSTHYPYSNFAFAATYTVGIDAIAQLYVTKLYVIQESFAIASSVAYSKIRQIVSNSDSQPDSHWCTHYMGRGNWWKTLTQLLQGAPATLLVFLKGRREKR